MSALPIAMRWFDRQIAPRLPHNDRQLSTCVTVFRLQCFYEYVDAGNKLTGSYEVLSGGLLDIDATVRSWSDW